jgi:hypothetical protein
MGWTGAAVAARAQKTLRGLVLGMRWIPLGRSTLKFLVSAQTGRLRTLDIVTRQAVHEIRAVETGKLGGLLRDT